MTVVFDTNVVVSAIFWGGASRRCFVHWARRRFQMAITPEVLDEYTALAIRMSLKTGIRSAGYIEWIKVKAKVFDASPLGKQRSRDNKDDIFPSCALASRAVVIVSKDKDLLCLGKPFGIMIQDPDAFLKRMR